MSAHPGRDRDPADVLDPGTGKVRVLARRCATCIFRPADPMHLGPERLRQVIEANLRAGALLTCHATLPYGDHPHFGPAVCAGFWARHRDAVPAGRLAQLLLGILRIQPPHDDRSDQFASDQFTASTDAPTSDSPQRHRAAATGAGAPPAGARPGSRIRLVSTSDPYTNLRPGALGTVTGIDDLGTLAVRWDDGHTLGLIPGLDQFDIL